MDDGRTSYTVGRVAEVAGVTVRTLRHYDDIGLLPPSGRTQAGYRHYAVGDLERLSQILYYRELGFTLEQISTLLDDPRRREGTPAPHVHGSALHRVHPGPTA